MVDPNKPIVDTRTTVTGEGQAPAGTPVQQNSGSTPPANTPPAIQPGGTQSSTTVKTSTVSSVPITSEVPPDFSSSSYAELYPKVKNYLDAHRPLSKEELAKLRRKQKIEGIISGISDAAQSVANLFYTTQYAPNMYDPKEGMSAKAKARFEKELADRKAEDDDWFNKVLMWGKLMDADAKDERNWQHMLARERRTDAIAEAKEKRDQQFFDLNLQLQGHKIDEAEAKAKRERILANYAEDTAQAELETERARGRAQQASASASNARAGYYNRDGGKEKKRYTLTVGDTTKTYDTEEDYERAVHREAKRLGIATHQVVRTTETSGRGGHENTHKDVATPKPISQLAGEVEEKSRVEMAPPSRRTTGEKPPSRR